MAEVLQFLHVSVQVAAVAFFAMIPGTVVWLAVIGIYSLLRMRMAARGEWQQQVVAERPTA